MSKRCDVISREEFDIEFNSLTHIGQNADELWEVVQELQSRGVRSMIEIGVSRGGSMWIWNLATQQGQTIGVDNEDRITSSQEPIFWEFTPNITYIVGDSHSSEIIQQVASVLNGAQVDFLWIDGDHSYKGCKADFENYSSFVKPGGLIGIHDYNLFSSIRQFVDTLPNTRLIDYEMGTVLVTK